MRSLVPALALLVLVGCIADVGTGKTAATITESPTAVTAGPAVATTLKVDPARSTLSALGAKITATHPIAFHDFTGEVGLAADGAVASVGFVAQMATLTSDNSRLTDHLKKQDFFWVEKYPTAEFVSTEVLAGSAVPGATHTVSGDLTIRGQTKRVTFPAAIATSPAGVTASAEFVIDRRDFGVIYPGKKDDLVQDNVVLTIQFVAAPGTT